MKKEKKNISASEKASMSVAKALTTSKAYVTTIGMFYHTRMFLLWLLNYASESEMKKAIVKTNTGLAIRPGKGSIIPASFLVTCAENTTGRADTVRLFNGSGEFTGERMAFASPKFPYEGFNVGLPMVKRMSAKTGLPESAYMQVQQGKKNYYWNDDFSLLSDYFLKAYSKEENKPS